MAPERDNDLPPVEPARRLATVRGLRPRLWTKRVLDRGAGEDSADPGNRQPPPADPEPPGEDPLTYDEQAHLHGGPKPKPRVDLQD